MSGAPGSSWRAPRAWHRQAVREPRSKSTSGTNRTEGASNRDVVFIDRTNTSGSWSDIRILWAKSADSARIRPVRPGKK